MNKITCVVFVLLVATFANVAKGNPCNFIGATTCSLLPCSFINPLIWDTSLSVTADVSVSSLALLNVKLSLTTSSTIASLNIGGGLLGASASLTVKAGATLRITGDLNIQAGSTIIVEGTLIVDGAVNIKGIINVNAHAIVIFNNNLFVDVNAQLSVTAAGLTVHGSVSINGKLNLNACISVHIFGAVNVNAAVGAIIAVNCGDLHLYSTLSIAAGASVSLQTTTLTVDLCATISGTLTIKLNAFVTLNGCNLLAGAIIEVKAGGKLTLAASVTIAGILYVRVGAQLVISGNVIVSVNIGLEGSVLIIGTLNLGVNVYTQISGTLTLQTPGVCIAATVNIAAGASLIGCGNIQAAVIIAGQLTATINGAISISGSLSLAATATVNIQITSLSVFGIVNVNGPLSCSGTLAAVCINGYIAASGSTFPCITHTSVSGSFNAVVSIPSSPSCTAIIAAAVVTISVN